MKYSKLLSVILALVMILSMVIEFMPIVNADLNALAHTTYIACNEMEFSSNATKFAQIQSQLPIGTTLKNAKGLYFNYKLWHDKRIVVYGNHDSVVSNSFVLGSQDIGGNYNVSAGYYRGTRGGITGAGEYRYHGQDLTGNNYTNINFKNDFPTTMGLSDKKWMYTPWANTSVTKDKPALSSFNQKAQAGNAKAREWIGRTADAFTIGNAFDEVGKELSTSKYSEKWNFIHVLTPPSATHPGEGRMWHNTNNQGLRYQTLSIQPVIKQPTNIQLRLELLTPQSALNVTDTNDATAANSTVPVKVKVIATLQDEAYLNDPVEKVNHYTRNDIVSWAVTIGGSTMTGVSNSANIATKEYTINYKISDIRSRNFADTIYATAYTTYIDTKNSTTATASLPISFTKKPAPPPPSPIPFPLPPKMIALMPNIPDRWYDIVEFPSSDSTDLTDVVSREVFINGSPIDADQFFSGKYIFGEDKVGLNHISMKWTTSDGQELEATRWTVIYSTKPNAEYRLTGSYIENRKMTASDNSVNSNLDFVISRYPIIDYKWSFRELTGETDNLKTKEISTTIKDFLCKKPGTYEIELVVTNALGRKSNPYIVTFTILNDYHAAVICNLNNSVLARNESITTYAYEVVSTDGDIIASNIVELWYDSDNNGAYDQLLNTWYNITTFPTYTPTKLGKYKFVNKVAEEFGHPTIPEFITAADRKSITVEREFWVDNYIPMTGLYVDIPIVRPEVDVFFMMDQNLKKPSLDWIINNRMNINNSLRLSNIVAKVENWDLKTYTYNQPASTTKNTGSSYPTNSTLYTSNGYSGTLNRISVSDNGSYQDFGSYKSGTESQSFSDSWTNNSSSSGWTNPWTVESSSDNPAPGSMYVSSGGFSGSIPRTSTTTNYNTGYVYGSPVGGRTPWSSSSSYTAYYSGTLTRTVSVWVPNMQWVPNYTGYYEGTIFKDIKQPYAAPFAATHKKYVIYVSDSNIANITDLNMVTTKNDVDVILIGSTSAQSQIAHSYFVLNDGSSVDTLVNKTLQWIADQNPVPTEDVLTTQNTVFTLSEADYDQEGDPLINKYYQYVHNKDYYDNPTGQEAGTQIAYSDTIGWTTTKKDRFANVGLYTIYRRVEDRPTTDPNFAEYNKTSNIPALTVGVHRIPIASPVMTWKYNATTCLYELTFKDNSYDLDHQFSRADKGIIETQMRYRQDTGEWNYKMPTNLIWGNYTIEYSVKDVEYAWSNPYVMNISLLQVPPASITIESTTTPKDARMRGDTTIPAGEIIQITSLDKTSGPIIHSNVPISTAEILVNGYRQGNLELTQISNQTEYLYNTNVFEYLVPQNQADGNINITIRAATNIGNQTKDKIHSAPVYTPIWEDYSSGRLSYISRGLDGIDSTMELSLTTGHEKLNDINVVTSKYTNKIQVSIAGITYYVFNNGTVGTNLSGAGAAGSLTVNSTYKYKIIDIKVDTNANNREWCFKFSVVNNFPLKLNQPSIISITGYDEAGNAATTSNKHSYNPQSKTITPNNYFLYKFRVVKVRDLQLESYYKNPLAGAGQPLYIDKPIFAMGMAVDDSNFGNMSDGLTKGYMFEFEIDSQNFNESTDEIVIEPHFYTTDAFARDSAEREIYWEDSNHQVYKVGEGGHYAWEKVTLTALNRVIKVGEEATWRGEYLIPGTTWAVPKGTSMAQAKVKNLKRDIIVNFHIKGYKNGMLQFDYNEEQWGKERTFDKYPYLIGDVIRYSWDKNCLDDISAKDNR